MQTEKITQIELEPQTRAFYCQALQLLNESKVPFLVAGAFAFERHTGIARPTKDLDIFVRPQDKERTMEVLSAASCETEVHSQHWLAKAFCGENFVDIIFNSANGITEVDNGWFQRAVNVEVLGIPVQICSPEDLLWSKSFVMARDRYDGADVAHLLLTCGERLDWSYLLHCFGSDWRVLFSHLILFGFIYPTERSLIPNWVMQELSKRLQDEINNPPPKEKLCQGTLLSPLQYLIDVEQWGYKDGRLQPAGNLTAEEVSQWTTTLTEEIESKSH
ncbi:hypothetical protein NUACC21_79330 [Scytonema sp. NUACC21]